MNNPKISVIMAVYNAEPYLCRCLDSLQAQTLADFDVIFVDDGSIDASLAIGQEYALKDSRFRIYHKENGGVSSARQFGVNQLPGGGKYSIHLDPDDWVEPTMLERLYEKAEQTGAEMVICDFYQNTVRNQSIRKQNPRSETGEGALRALFQRLHGSLWNKLIRSACYRDYAIRFPEGLDYCEDYLVNVQLLQHIHKVAYLPEAFYHYDQYSNQQPATRNEDSKRIDTTRTEVVRRCREMVPDSMKCWQYQLFEVHNAFDIINMGSMLSSEFRDFFKNIPFSLLAHPHRYYTHTVLTLLVIHGPLSRRQAASIYHGYMSVRKSVGRLIRTSNRV